MIHRGGVTMTITAVRVAVLGPVEVRRDGSVVAIGGSRRAALVALLALRAPHAVDRSALIDGLWGEHPPEAATNALQVHVSALRKVLGREAVQTHGHGYRLGDNVSVDAGEFTRGHAQGQREAAAGETEAAADTFREALALWRGAALSGIEDAPFIVAEAARLEELRLSALSSRIKADLDLGRHGEVVPELQVLVAQHPLREDVRESLMSALYRSDRQAEALAVYDAGRRVLRDELGIEPSPALRELHQRLLRQTETVPDRVVSTHRHLRLPGLLDETFGRVEDLRALEELLTLEGTRLVSILGSGGVGKTRVSIELANRLIDRYRDGVAFVPLAEADKVADVAATICTSVGLRAGDNAEETLITALQAREMLLVCDNFEHVADAAALLSTLLSAAPRLRMLVTSRVRLGLRGERQYHLAPLPAEASPGSQDTASVAAHLFLARLQTMDTTFLPSQQDWRDIEQICQQCDGLPLAIELAAAHTQALTLPELRQRLSHPFPMPGDSRSELPARQRTMRASVAWSIDGLPTETRQLLATATIFRGGFTLAAAANVAGLTDGATLGHLEILLDHSLLQRTRGQTGSHRFGLLETVRQYAAELLRTGEAAEAQRRHAEFFLTALGPTDEPRAAPRKAATWHALVADRANIRTAIRWSLGAPDPVLAADLVVTAALTWDQLGPRDELGRWLDELLQRDTVPPGRRADLLYWRTFLWQESGEAAAAAEATAEGLRITDAMGDTRRAAWLATGVAWGAIRVGDSAGLPASARRAADLAALHPEALQLQAAVLDMLAATATLRDDHASAIDYWKQAIDLAREHQLELNLVFYLNNLCEVELIGGQVTHALDHAEEGIALATRDGFTLSGCDLQSQRGYAHFRLGEPDEALADLVAALRGHLDHAELLFASDDALRLAAVFAETAPDRAAELLGIFDAGHQWAEEPLQMQTRDRFLTSISAQVTTAYAVPYQRGQQLVEQLGALGALAAMLESMTEQDPRLSEPDLASLPPC